MNTRWWRNPTYLSPFFLVTRNFFLAFISEQLDAPTLERNAYQQSQLREATQCVYLLKIFMSSRKPLLPFSSSFFMRLTLFAGRSSLIKAGNGNALETFIFFGYASLLFINLAFLRKERIDIFFNNEKSIRPLTCSYFIDEAHLHHTLQGPGGRHSRCAFPAAPL